MTADLSALLDSLEAAAAAATPGEWWVDGPGERTGRWWIYAAGVSFERREDAELIVAAVTALPVLIAELRAHQAAVQAVREQADSLEWETEHGRRIAGATPCCHAADRIRAAVAALDPKEQTDE